MKILICSLVFAPSIGGIETVTAILAEQFGRMGSKVTVVTHTRGETASAPFEVVRRPSAYKLFTLARQADVVWQNQISLRMLLPLLLAGRQIFITCQALPRRSDGRIGVQDRLKLAAYSRLHTVSISNAIAERLPGKTTVVGNPFQANEFLVTNGTSRDKDVVFMGRLVSDKGCDIAVGAVALLKQQGIHVSFTVIGDGPEMIPLQSMTAELGISNQVDFRGSMRTERGQELARHKIMVVPSIWAEPFGVVALEGIAAGCVVVASNAGGLPESVGPCGLLFPSGDVQAMAELLRRLLLDATLRASLLANRQRHLEGFMPENVAKRYLEIFKSEFKN